MTKTIDLIARLDHDAGVEPSAIVANRVLPALFDRRQTEIVDRLADAEEVTRRPAGPGVRQVSPRPRPPRLVGASATATSSAWRGIPAGLPVLYVPELFTKATGRRVVALCRRAGRGTGRESPMAKRRGPVPLDALLASKEMVLVLGSGGVGKTTMAAAIGLAAAVEQGGQVLAHGRPGPPPRRRPRCRGARQRRDEGARRGLRGCRRDAAWRAVGGDARHQGRRGTTSSAATRPMPRCAMRCSATRCTRTSPAGSCTATTTWRWSSCTTSTPRASTTWSSSTRRRRATPCRCSTRRRGCVSSSAAACCGGSPCRTDRGCSRWRPSPSTRSPIGSSGAVPPRHRRLLRALPGHGEGLRGPRPRGRGAARRRPDHVPRRVHAGDGAGPRGGVPGPRAAAPATTTSAR